MIKQSTLEATIGGLLHDAGKITCRIGGDSSSHSLQGCEMLRKMISDQNMLDCVMYHHADNLEKADIAADSPAYAVYMGNNIATGADKRGEIEDILSNAPMRPLTSVFGTMSGKINELAYPVDVFDGQKIICPQKADDLKITKKHYQKIYDSLMDKLSDVEYTEDYVNSILSVIEAHCCYLPSDAEDISLYDHVKLTAAFASCINEYCIEYGITDYRKMLFYDEKVL